MATTNILSFHEGLNICFSSLHYRVFPRIAVVPFERSPDFNEESETKGCIATSFKESGSKCGENDLTERLL